MTIQDSRCEGIQIVDQEEYWMRQALNSGTVFHYDKAHYMWKGCHLPRMDIFVIYADNKREMFWDVSWDMPYTRFHSVSFRLMI